MTNAEKYKDEIRAVMENRSDYILAITKAGKGTDCRYIQCKDCIFDGKCGDRKVIEWLVKEAEEDGDWKNETGNTLAIVTSFLAMTVYLETMREIEENSNGKSELGDE